MVKQVVCSDNLYSFGEFNLSDIREHPTILNIGCRQTGKTSIIKALINNLNYKKDNIIIFDRVKSYDQLVNKKNIHNEYKSEEVEKILKEQKLQINKFNKGIISEEDTKIFIIFDDCLSSKSSFKDLALRELLYFSKDYKIGFIMAMQFPFNIPPELRLKFDYVFLIGDTVTSHIKRHYDEYGSIFNNFYSFRCVYSELTKDYNCMIIDNRVILSDNIFDKVYYYKAPYLNEPNIKIDNVDDNLIYGTDLEPYLNEIENKTNDLSSNDDLDKTTLLKIVNIMEKIVNKLYS